MSVEPDTASDAIADGWQCPAYANVLSVETPMRTVIKYLGSGLFGSSSSDGRHKIEVQDLGDLRNALGPDLLRCFCQLFVGTDHLRTLAHLMRLNYQQTESEIAQNRNLTSLVLLSWGVTRETARVLRRLRRLGVRGMLVDTAPWDRLEEVWQRWDTDPLFRRLRDKLSFHFDDSQLFDEGIQRICQEHERFVCFEADGRQQFKWRDSLGLYVVLKGLALEEPNVRLIARFASQDIGTLSSAIHEVFIALVEAKRR